MEKYLLEISSKDLIGNSFSRSGKSKLIGKSKDSTFLHEALLMSLILVI